MPGLLTLASGCGVWMAGTWQDDPANWQRAFEADKPADVVVVHSSYWRSPHWSMEYAWFFELEPTVYVPVDRSGLRLLGEGDAKQARDDWGPGAPGWFAPKEPRNYEVWVIDQTLPGAFQLWVDRNDGHLFLTDYQL